MKGEKLSKITKLEIPRRAGLASSTKHVLGFSPRHNKTTMEPGTNPKKVPGEIGGGGKRKAGGLSHDTAPYKHQSGIFGGSMGMAGPGEDEPI